MTDLKRLSEIGLSMLDRALTSVASRDVAEAEAVCRADDNADALYKQIFNVTTDITPDVTLMVDGEQIYVGANGRVACYGQFGQRLWLNDLGTSAGVGFAVPGMAQQVDLT